MSFGQDIAHLPGGAMLLLSFILLYQRRVTAVVDALAAQGAMLALAAAWQGWVQGAPQLYLVALLAAGTQAVLIPLALRALLRKRGVEPALGIGPGLIAGIALAGLAILLVQPLGAGGHAAVREDLALALSILLLGLLLMVARRGALMQVVGLLSLENGLVLAAVSLPGMPQALLLVIAGLVLLGGVLAGLFAFRLREGFGGMEAAFLAARDGEGG